MSVVNRMRIPRQARVAMACAGAVAGLLTMAVVPAAASNLLVPIAQISMPMGEKLTSFDISFVANGHYYLADRTNNAVDVISTSTNTVTLQAGQGLFTGVKTSDTSGPNGVWTVGSNIWAGDGDSTLKILSSGGSLLATIQTVGATPATVGFTGNRVDEGCYDPVDNIGLSANDAASPWPFISFHDGTSGAVIAQIVFDGALGDGPKATNGIEQCQYNPRDGKFYLNVPEVNGPGNDSVAGAVVRLDPSTHSILGVYVVPVSSCAGPQGMAIGPKPQILLGCHATSSAVLDDGSTGGIRGSVFATLTHEEGADEADYNSGTGQYTLGNSNHNAGGSCTAPITAGPQVIGVVDAATDTNQPNVPTGLFNCKSSPHGGNHSVASDASTMHTFLPVASTSGGTLCGSVGGDDTVGCVVVLMPLTLSAHDLNSDSRSDIVFRDGSGNLAAWLMNGAIGQAQGIGSVPTSWSIVGQRDFNHDFTADLLWRNLAGDVAVWFMNGTQLAATAGLGNVTTFWSIYGTGDLNGDHKGDILWRNSSGDLAVWFMNGSNVTSAAGLGNVATSWTIAGDDDMGHIFWRDNAGNLAAWYVYQTEIVNTVGLGSVPNNWVIAGIGDFNGDGYTDILWRDTNSGAVAIWFLDGKLQIKSMASLGTVPLNWSIVQTGDYNGDGNTDILWEDGTGNLAAWFMNGSTIASTAGYGNIGTSFMVQSANAE
jgi:FG-GAP-like repeat